MWERMRRTWGFHPHTPDRRLSIRESAAEYSVEPLHSVIKRPPQILLRGSPFLRLSI